MGKRWLIGVLTTIIMAFSAWLALGQISLTERMRAVEANHETIQKGLDRIEDKLDTLLLGGRRDGTTK